MRLIITFFLLLILFPAPGRAANPEFRALWVHNWGPGLLCEQQVGETVKWAKDANLNALIVQVRRLGDAYYCSACEPRADNILAGPEYDPLGCVITQARAAGLEVHAWFNVYRVGAKTGLPTLPNHVATLHPEWLTKDEKGNTLSAEGAFLDPGVPAARQYLLTVISDLVSKYELDGLMLDYIRYPGKNWGYNDIAIAEFNKAYGRTGKPLPDDPAWRDWRRQQVTQTVQAISETVHRLKPGMKLSAATIAWGKCDPDFTQTSAYKTVFQDWPSWMRQGFLDANMPMNYKDPTNPKLNQWFADWVVGAKKWSYGRHVYCGLMLYNSIPGAIKQIKLALDNGADGVVGLSFSQATFKDELARKLKSTVFSAPSPTPSMAWKLSVQDKPSGL